MTLISYWEPVLDKSLALNRFTNDHTVNNEFYWQTVLTKILACKFSASLNPDDIVLESPHVKNHPEPFRFPHKFNDWKNKISDHENWIRLNTLLASTSYLERYIYEISVLSLSNDPGVLIGKERTVNGVHYLKSGIPVKGLEIVEYFTKGSWHQRYNYLKSYFIFTNKIEKEKIDTLEKIRIIRNKIAHRFGRDFVTDINHFIKGIDPPERISEDRLKKYLGLIKDVVDILDSNIYRNHCGNFEIILIWHGWDKKENHKAWSSWSDSKKLTYYLKKYFRLQPITEKQIKPIITYYETS